MVHASRDNSVEHRPASAEFITSFDYRRPRPPPPPPPQPPPQARRAAPTSPQRCTRGPPPRLQPAACTAPPAPGGSNGAVSEREAAARLVEARQANRYTAAKAQTCAEVFELTQWNATRPPAKRNTIVLEAKCQPLGCQNWFCIRVVDVQRSQRKRSCCTHRSRVEADVHAEHRALPLLSPLVVHALRRPADGGMILNRGRSPVVYAYPLPNAIAHRAPTT